MSSSIRISYRLKRFVGITASSLLFAASHGLAHADATANYPDKPIRLVVPTAPGGAGQMLAHVVGPALTQAWGQPVVVDHRAGAGGTIGTDVVAKAKPDGCTLVLGSIGNIMISTAVYPDAPYDGARDFAPVINLVNQPIVLVAHPSFKANTVKELIDHAALRPGKVVYGSTGIGSAMHMGGELLQQRTGISLIHVPYKGGGPGLTDLIGGHIPLLFVGLAPTLPHIHAGKIKAIAVVGSKRANVIPDVPTAAETLPGYEVNYWSGVLAPRGTPREVVAKLNREIAKTLNTPHIRKRLEDSGFEVLTGTPEQFASTIRIELEKWGKVVRLAGIKPD